MEQHVRRVKSRVQRQIVNARRDGWLEVLRDDARRGILETRRLVWGLRHNCAPNATPLYVVGLPRSGTTMMIGAFRQSPEAEVYHEGHSRAFTRYALRDDDVLREIVTSSRQRCVVFKPLLDSHRLVHLMEDLGTPSRGRTIWMYRNVDDRMRSFYAKWPERTGADVRKIAAGHRGWETAGLSDEHLALLHRFEPEKLSPPGGEALFWYVRNMLFFDLGLDKRSDVALMSYDRFIAEPERFMPRLCGFAGIEFEATLVSGISKRPPPTSAALDIEPEIATLCADMQRRLDDAFERQADLLAGGSRD